MALQAAYKRFLAAPSSSDLADDASLHYVTTTTSFTGATEIIKHLGSVRNKIKKKKEDALFAIENQHALALEVDTALEFVSSGGPYLPGMDDNFLADRSVTLAVVSRKRVESPSPTPIANPTAPQTHIVTFDREGKITQIRQSWDQGCLLKQIEVIGRSGQNWPIRDSKDQISLIAKCAKGDGVAPATTEARPTRSRGSSTNAMRDPHASLDLFASRDEIDETPEAVVSPYAGSRPHQRSFTEILGDEPEEPSSPSAGRERSQSPSKAIAPKAGAKNFQPMRLFDVDEKDVNYHSHEARMAADRVVRPDPKKYQHFELDDGSEDQDVPTPKPAAPKPAADNRKSKHGSNWSFDDFVTPQKPTATRGLHRARDVRHWKEDNEVLENTPAPNAAVPKPRRDAEAHFELIDDGPKSDEPRHAGLPRGTLHNEGLHLYDNRLHTEDGTVPSPGPAPLGNITNLKDRRKDFDAHFDMTDASPHHKEADEPTKVPEDRKKAVRMMESNWSPYDESPVSRKENDNPKGTERGIVIAGDGMGGKKGTGRGWLHGEEDEPAPTAKKGGRGPPTKSDNFWDF